jgi:hypothetical protein
MFGAKRLSLNRDTESVVVLAPNIGLRLEPVRSNRNIQIKNYFCGQGASGSMPRSILARRS